jgi:hypothetical protein
MNDTRKAISFFFLLFFPFFPLFFLILFPLSLAPSIPIDFNETLITRL